MRYEKILKELKKYCKRLSRDYAGYEAAKKKLREMLIANDETENLELYDKGISCICKELKI